MSIIEMVEAGACQLELGVSEPVAEVPSEPIEAGLDRSGGSAFYLIVCGGRELGGASVRRQVEAALERYLSDYGSDLRILQGGALGVDRIAKNWAARRGVKAKQFDADWKAEPKRAGYLRNEEMVKYLDFVAGKGHRTHVLAVPGAGPGTGHTMRIAKAHGHSVGMMRAVTA